MAGRRLVGLIALGGVALAPSAHGTAAHQAQYTLAATQACLTSLPNAVAGLPPATPPVPPALFVAALARDAASTWGLGAGPRRAHRQLGVWSGDRRYEGIILSFFGSADDARTSSRSVAGSYGGTLRRNVVASWDQKARPSGSLRAAVLGCLRSAAGGGHGTPSRPPRPATIATFAGGWGGHTRGLSITSSGLGRESADDGCCTRVYRMTFRILSVAGTLTRATALYRVTSFARYENGVRRVAVGDVGRLVLRSGIVTNTLTRDFFCSDPAWGATGACGA